VSGIVAAPGDFSAPSIEYAALAPMLIVFGAAIVGVLVEAFVPAARRLMSQVVLAVVAIVAAFVAVVLLAGDHSVIAEGAVANDGPALFLQGTILALGLASILLFAERNLDAGGGSALVAQAAALPGSAAERALPADAVQTEAFPLAMFALGGMMLFPAANDLLTMFVALEVLSLPLYLLCGLARRRRLLSQEAAVKYFLLGAFSSAFFLYGLALLYGYAGSVRLSAIADATQSSTKSDGLLVIGLALLSVGLLFKLSAVPFHAWTPDVYQGAPTPVTAFMAAGTKVAAFGALLRVFYVALGDVRWDWRPMMWIVAIATMVVGAVLAVTQTDIKRMLAYSSVAHAGFLLTGVIAANAEGLSGVLFYLLVYGFTTVGAFAIVTLVRDAGGEATHLSRWQGLGRRSPLVAGTFAFFLLALAGIPLTSGFAGKFAVFAAAIKGGATPLVVVGVLSSAVAAFFYIRVIVLMFFSEPAVDGPTVAIPSPFTAAAVALGLAVTVVLGVMPQPLLDLAQQAAPFVR
jgi:NADH-quinone oxidoreductase subunit N